MLRRVLAVLSGNPVVLLVMLLGLIGGMVLMAGQRWKLHVFRAVGLVLLTGSFGFLFFVTRTAEGPAWLLRIGGRLAGAVTPGSSISLDAAVASLESGEMQPEELSGWLGSGRVSLHTSDSPLYRALRLLVEGNLPPKYHASFAEWLVANYPAWVEGGSMVEQMGPELLRLLPAEAPQRAAMLELMIAGFEDPANPAPVGWAESLDAELLCRRLSDKQAERYLIASADLRPLQLWQTSPFEPSQLAEIVEKAPDGARSYRLISPKTSARVEAPSATVLRFATPSQEYFQAQTTGDRLGWIHVPPGPGAYTLSTEWTVSVDRDDVLAFLDLNPRLWPAGLRPEDLRSYTAKATLSHTYTIAAPTSPAPPVLVDEPTREAVELFSQKPQAPQQLRGPRSGQRAGIDATLFVKKRSLVVEITGPPVDLAADAFLEIGGERLPIGFLFARKGGADKLTARVTPHDWRTQKAFLVLRPNPSAAASTPGLSGIYNGPEIRVEIVILGEEGF